MAIIMQYGAMAQSDKRGDASVIHSGVISDGQSVTLTFAAGGIYELFSAEYTAATGAYRGHRMILIKIPEAQLYGSAAAAHVTVASGGSSGVNITYNNDSSITLAQSSATYNVVYAVRAVCR